MVAQKNLGMKNTINFVEDGRIEIIFSQPMSKNTGKEWLYMIGYHRGSEVIVKNDRIIGVRVHPEVWRDILAKNNPTKDRARILQEFDEVMKGK